MKTLFSALLPTAFAVLLGGCASTTLTSFSDPEFVSRQYPTIVIYAPFSDLESMSLTERAFLDEAKSHNVTCVAGSTIILPTRTLTASETSDAFVKSAIPAVLQLEITDEGEDTTITPPSLSASTETRKRHDKTVTETSIHYSGGEIITKPRLRMALKLIDVKSNNVAWICTSHTEGTQYATFQTCINSLASSAMDKLVDDKMVKVGR